ncbi:MAG: hypothetical protein WDO70_05830 [Alphaproteobacteria bacterium]
MHLKMKFMLAVCLVALTCCSAPLPKDEQKVIAELPVGTVDVKLYAGELSIYVLKDGTVLKAALTDKEKPKNDLPPMEGGSLTPYEIEVLRHSVFYAPMPTWSAACCIPRHAFLFYDKDGQYLGHLKVCFQCSCAELKPYSPPDSKLTHIEWNYTALQKIVENHKLPVKFRY